MSYKRFGSAANTRDSQESIITASITELPEYTPRGLWSSPWGFWRKSASWRSIHLHNMKYTVVLGTIWVKLFFKIKNLSNKSLKRRARSYHRTPANGGSWEEGFRSVLRGFLDLFAGSRLPTRCRTQKHFYYIHVPLWLLLSIYIFIIKCF